jgi:hypothetical protein
MIAQIKLPPRSFFGVLNGAQRRDMARTFLILIAMAVITGSVAAQAPKRIHFAKGKSSAVVKDSSGRYGIAYVVRARSGQKLVLDLSPASMVGIKVEFDGTYGEMVLLREEKGGHYEIGLEESGDYTIFIGSINNLPVRFSLTVKVTKMADV